MFDLAIIGGGPAGYVAAEKAGAAGLGVVLFEKRELGGVCLNEGCIPTKTLLNCAKHYRYAVESAGLGVTVEGAKFDHAQVIERKKKVVKTLALFCSKVFSLPLWRTAIPSFASPCYAQFPCRGTCRLS